MKIHSDASRALAALLTLTLIGVFASQLVGCGGVDSGGTGQTVQSVQASSAGRITGFGSVIVNGVRFDDTPASIVDDAGTARTRADLKLGMVVDIDGEVQGNSGNGVARRIQFGSEIAGRLESIDLSSGRLSVLGQAVQVDVDTLYGSSPTGLAGLVVGDLLEVFAFYDPGTGVYMATRVERQATLASFKLRGRISDLDSTSFSIGGARIDYSGIAPSQRPQLANGQSVRVSLKAASSVAGRWVATTLSTSQRHFPDASEARVEGFVSSFVSRASFVVAGVPVDASGGRGSLSQLANGVRISVTGTMRNGVLVATEIEIRRSGGGDQEFELHGAIESVDLAAQTFVLRGVTVAYDAGTVFAPGRPVDLVVGAMLEVRGVPPASGVGLLAKMIKVER
jgi:hypothetical protein